MKRYFVYIMSNRFRTIYTGMTNNLERRVYEHKHKVTPGFTSKYNCDRLVYYEETNSVHVAIEREKEIKDWRRSLKVSLVESKNPSWQDLSADWSVPDSILFEDLAND